MIDRRKFEGTPLEKHFTNNTVERLLDTMEGTMSSPSVLSVTSDSASVLAQINEIESRILNQTVSPRDSVTLLLQLNQVKLNILQGELKGVDSDETDENDIDENYSYRDSVVRPQRADNLSMRSEAKSTVKQRNVPYQISIYDGDEGSSSISTLDRSLRTPYPSSDLKSLVRLRTMSRLPETEITPDLRIVEKTGSPSFLSIAWDVLVYMITFPVSDFCIPREGPGAKKAWREKVAIFALFLLVSACFVTVASILPLLLCTETEGIYDAQQVSEDGNVILFGKVYDLHNFAPFHFQSSKTLERFFGQDASQFFPRLPPTDLPRSCLNTMLGEEVFNSTNAYGLQNITCPNISAEQKLRYGDPCHTSIVGQEQINEKLGSYEIGYLVIPQQDLLPNGLPDGTQYILIDNIIYNVTQYVTQFRYVDTPGSLPTTQCADNVFNMLFFHNRRPTPGILCLMKVSMMGI
jgi:hypothetical protein